MLTKSDLNSIDKIVSSRVCEEVDPVKKEVKSMKKSIKKIDKNVSVMLNMLNKDDMHLIKRVKRVEERLDLPPLPQN